MSGPLHGHVVVVRDDFRLDLELDVAPGEVVAVLGPNGAGKSTLLRAVAGLEPLTDGRLTLGGVTVDDPAADVLVEPARRRIGLLFQDYRLFPHLTVAENVAFGPRSTGRSRSDSRAAADSWLQRFDLAQYADRRPGEVSGGQAQRVALARALACEPQALLLDEPLAALDAGTRIDVRADLRSHLREFAGPTLLVTHDPLDALALADRLIVLEHGRVTQQGSVGEIARRPATDYVARLLGLNLLRGTAHDTTVALDGGGELHLAEHAPAARVLVAVRPSAIAVHRSRPEGSPRNCWEGIVEGVEPVGERVRATVRGLPSVVVDLTPGAVAELGVKPGAAVWLSTKATDLEAYPD